MIFPVLVEIHLFVVWTNTGNKILKFKDVIILSLAGLVSPYIWTLISNVFSGMLFVSYVDSKIVFSTVGAISALISSAIFYLPAGYYLKGSYILSGIYYVFVFFVVTLAGMYFTGGLKNAGLLYSSTDTWLYLLFSLMFLYIGSHLRSRKH